MHSFTVVPPPEPGSLPPSFLVLNPSLGKYVAGEYDVQELGHRVGLATHYLSLHRLSSYPGQALHRAGCENARAVMATSDYFCGFSGRDDLRRCLVPLGIVTSMAGLQKYEAAFAPYVGEASALNLHLLNDGDRFGERNLYVGVDPSQSPWPTPCYTLTRFEQLYAGSGYTREMLESQHFEIGRGVRMDVAPVHLALSNGDTLVAYAYSQATA